MTRPAPELRVLLRIRIEPGHEAEFEELWLAHSRTVRTFPDNHGQQLLTGGTGDYTVLTDWTDEPAFRAFEQSPEQQAYLQRLWPMRAGGEMQLLAPLHECSSDVEFQEEPVSVQQEQVTELIELVESVPSKQLEAAVAEREGGLDAALTLVFELLVSEFNPKKADGQKGVFQFDIASTEGQKLHYVHVEAGECRTDKGQHDSPDITIGIKFPDMMAMGVGKLPGAKAFLTGKLKLRGSPLMGTKLGEWFDHPEV
ncbi:MULTISPECIES: antibiotic biosynthesis monooxygenase [Streptomyces]|uniref:Antibiotic biosynthesis monooxygenase n=1 Tax=Streptomyces solicathayae TaxID=3081768 RepID=A0ABZ0LXR7_9ACTN|nr:antibiotic biosynthesis monooxygenase [Streptomyces sp. HUAS YS2]WOX24229.1 antibiotic biosynthesis monooxygenase [Streptomyces sp. HUAS YS2]